MNSKSKTNSQKRKKRGSLQKRENSQKLNPECIKMISILKEEIWNSDYKQMSLLPINVPYIQGEEISFIKNMVENLSNIDKEETELNILIIKSVARIKSLNKIWNILK